MTDKIEEMMQAIERRNSLGWPALSDSISALFATVRKEREWTSVEERLPARDVYVLWNLKVGQVEEGWYDPRENGMQFWRSTRLPSMAISLAEVTHWRPLPAPPESKEPS